MEMFVKLFLALSHDNQFPTIKRSDNRLTEAPHHAGKFINMKIKAQQGFLLNVKPFSPKPRTLSASVADAPRFCFFSGTRFTFALAFDLLLADVCSS